MCHSKPGVNLKLSLASLILVKTVVGINNNLTCQRGKTLHLTYEQRIVMPPGDKYTLLHVNKTLISPPLFIYGFGLVSCVAYPIAW